MSGWMIGIIIASVLGFIASNILLLKQSAKMKVPESVLKAIKEREKAEQLKQEQEEQDKKKPNDD